MKKKIIHFPIVSILITSISIQTAIAQSWNITGNNNATSNSKLGTTNLVPLKLFTNNSERVRIDESGRVGIGINTPVNILTVKSSGGTPAGSWLNGLTKPVFFGFAETVSSEFVLSTAANTSTRRSVFQGRRAGGTLAAPTVVLDNDYLTSLLASGFDGSTFQNPASIDFYVDGTPSAGNVPARISLVTGSNVSNRVERLRVGSTGNFNFNNDQLFLQQSNGNLGIGTTTPVSKLEVRNGALTITNTITSANLVLNRANSVAGSSNQISFQDNGITKWALGGTNIGSAGANNFSFHNYNLGSNALTILNSNNNVGIGTTSPGSRLQVVAGYDGDGISVVGSSFGPKDAAFTLVDDLGHSGSLGLASANNAFMSGVESGDMILSNAGGKIHVGTGSPSSFPIMTVSGGTVGIGTRTPGYLLDVAGRMRIRSGNGTAGTWFMNGTNTVDAGFVGMLNDNYVGIYGTGIGWGFIMNTASGNVGIGTFSPAYKLDVCGTIRAKELRVETGWCDYVFADDYKLPALSEVESFIKKNKHLPGVTKGSEIETEGLEVGKVSSQMIRKIEELTLYIIELQKQVDELKTRK